jgi:hypothetical protein
MKLALIVNALSFRVIARGRRDAAIPDLTHDRGL